jgi:regulator of replication initiation timing
MVHDYGELTPEEADKAFGLYDLTIYPLRCPECGAEEFPTHAVGFDASKDAEIFRTRIGTVDMPVVGGNVPYAVVRSLEEMAEYERGLAKLASLFREKEAGFWESFTAWAEEDWPNKLKELSKIELSLGLSAAGKPAPPELSAAAHRQRALKLRGDERRVFWRAANRHLIEKEFLFDPPDFWDTESWAQKYGRDRVLWVLLNFLLPEELEQWRTEKLAPLVKKKSGALWERVRQLGQALDKQRRRAEELSQTVFDLRQETARLQEKLAAEREERRRLSAEVEKLRQAEAPAERDRAKLERYKALVREL